MLEMMLDYKPHPFLWQV